MRPTSRSTRARKTRRGNPVRGSSNGPPSPARKGTHYRRTRPNQVDGDDSQRVRGLVTPGQSLKVRNGKEHEGTEHSRASHQPYDPDRFDEGRVNGELEEQVPNTGAPENLGACRAWSRRERSGRARTAGEGPREGAFVFCYVGSRTWNTKTAKRYRYVGLCQVLLGTSPTNSAGFQKEQK